MYRSQSNLSDGLRRRNKTPQRIDASKPPSALCFCAPPRFPPGSYLHPRDATRFGVKCAGFDSSRRKHLGRRAHSEQTVCMANKNPQSVRRAAKEVSEIMAASLCQFSPAEQDRRLKAIHKIALRAGARKREKESAAKALTELAMEHLAGYSRAERNARIRAFRRKVAALKKTS